MELQAHHSSATREGVPSRVASRSARMRDRALRSPLEKGWMGRGRHIAMGHDIAIGASGCECQGDEGKPWAIDG